ncbi:hypothetical protein WAF17_20510 [Bernardetia sp. ABR2-2B]|uniref:hypothetical protein n=1 Tax=Bernardetia sp. ABR2-2B TaxID=3127472 RepID=UPI0030CF3868
MNKISTKTYKNTFSKANFYIIEIDNKSLEDIILESQTDIARGLVPTLLNWLDNPLEQKVVWERTLPSINEKLNLPILMCSEDIDLWCTLIIVEVEVKGNFVYWNKFGIENSDAVTPQEIGKSINWFLSSPSFVFDKNNYINVLDEFRLRLDENIDYTPKHKEMVEDYKL